MGNNIFEMVRRAFLGEKVDPGLNRTLLVLIPKTLEADSINQFWPISLCTMLYKVITKTVVIPLRQAMQILVKQNQASFIASRNITDNTILAQEATHTMKNTKSKRGWMAIKVDLEP